MNIQESFLTVDPWTRPGTKRIETKGVILHYVGNPATRAIDNRNYFESLRTSHLEAASCHYIVGLAGEILQLVPEDEYSYASGWVIPAPLVTSEFGGNVHNATISIETCHLDADGTYSPETYKSMIALCADILKRYALPVTALYRHYDVCGEGNFNGAVWGRKKCPVQFVDHPDRWEAFKIAVGAFL